MAPYAPQTLPSAQYRLYHDFPCSTYQTRSLHAYMYHSNEMASSAVPRRRFHVRLVNLEDLELLALESADEAVVDPEELGHARPGRPGGR